MFYVKTNIYKKLEIDRGSCL